MYLVTLELYCKNVLNEEKVINLNNHEHRNKKKSYCGKSFGTMTLTLPLWTVPRLQSEHSQDIICIIGPNAIYKKISYYFAWQDEDQTCSCAGGIWDARRCLFACQWSLRSVGSFGGSDLARRRSKDQNSSFLAYLDTFVRACWGYDGQEGVDSKGGETRLMGWNGPMTLLDPKVPHPDSSWELSHLLDNRR